MAELELLISELKKKGGVWVAVANHLDVPTRKRRVVNVSRINLHTKENEVVVVSGKVLGSGILSHPVVVGAYSFSAGAKDVIEKSKGKCLSILELARKYPDGKSVRVIG